MSFDYDLFIIGAGPGGLAAAERAATYGVRIAIAEQDRVGGTCVIHGCIPEKLMNYAASFSQALQNADEYGWGKVSRNFDWSRFMEAKTKNIDHLCRVHTQHLQEAGVKLINGHAKFLDAHTVKIGNHQFTAEKILIAVGGKAIKPENISGIESAITTREMLDLKNSPEHLAIIGSNHIAVKCAGIMNALVPRVTLIVPEEQILPECDQDLQTAVQEGMSQEGIQILCQTRVEKIETVSTGLKLWLSSDNPTQLTVNTVVWIGDRVPNLQGLDLKKAGVKVEHGAIVVDEDNRTTQDNIFAVGDCTSRPRWTPVAIASGRAFADTEFGQTPHRVNYENIPHVVASRPEAATIGLTETQARRKFGDSVHCYLKKFQPLFNLMGESKQETLLKIVIDSNSDRIIGVHMVGSYAAEIIQMIAPAMKAGVTKKHFDWSIGIHPSIGEEFFTLR